MIRRWLPLLAVLVLPAPSALAAAGEVPGQSAGASPVVLLVDVSGSMNRDDGTGRIKINGAKQALLDFLAGVDQRSPLGLRTYPAGGLDDCNTGSAQFGISPRDPEVMSATIRTLRAGGDTPTAEALRAAAADIEDAGSTGGTIILLSDGESTCGDPCSAAKQIARKGVDLQAITIGFRVSAAGRQELECIADATDGAYVDANDNKGLEHTLGGLSSPVLELEASYPPYVVPEVGNDPDGAVHITATVSNSGERTARDVTVRLGFGGPAPGFLRPTRLLGNLEQGQSRRVEWMFRPSLLLSGRRSRFSILAGGENTRRPAVARGAIVFAGEPTAADAGDILKNRSIAILGDSYSSGEGTDEYLEGTATSESPCHRSRFTYLVESFSIPDSNIIACSGATTNDVEFPQPDRQVESQMQALSSLQESRGVDAVVLTLGGNPYFGDIAKDCIFGTCDSGDLPTIDQVEDSDGLVEAYGMIDSVVNSPDAIASRGSSAPIMVLAYPSPLPYTKVQCPGMLDFDVVVPDTGSIAFYARLALGGPLVSATATLATNALGFDVVLPGDKRINVEILSADEVELLGYFATQLNGVIEGATMAAREQLGAKAYFVPNTEVAFQPDHSVCDTEPYARTLTSMNIPVEEVLKVVTSAAIFDLNGAAEGVEALIDGVLQGRQELVHPNQLGYGAVTSAAIRWSLGQEADRAVDDLAVEASPREAPPAPKSSNADIAELAQEEGGAALEAGTLYRLTADGFLANSTVTVTLNSEPRLLASIRADETGSLDTRVGIPSSTEAGEHSVELAGFDPDGGERIVRLPVVVGSPGEPSTQGEDSGGVPGLIVGLAAFGALAGVLALALAALARVTDRHSRS